MSKLNIPYQLKVGDRIVTAMGENSFLSKNSQGWVLRIIAIHVDKKLGRVTYEAKELETYHVYFISAYDVDWYLTGRLNGFENYNKEAVNGKRN